MKISDRKINLRKASPHSNRAEAYSSQSMPAAQIAANIRDEWYKKSHSEAWVASQATEIANSFLARAARPDEERFYIRTAKNLHFLKNYDLEEACLRHASEFSTVRLHLGELYESRGRSDMALQLYARPIKDPSRAHVFGALPFLLSAHDFDQICHNYKSLLASGKLDLQAQLHLHYLILRSGTPKEAVASAVTLLDTHWKELPDSPTLLSALGGLALQSTAGKPHKLALQALRKAVALNGNHFDAGIRLAKAILSSHPNEAISILDHLTTLNPRSGQAWALLVRAYLNKMPTKASREIELIQNFLNLCRQTSSQINVDKYRKLRENLGFFNQAPASAHELNSTQIRRDLFLLATEIKRRYAFSTKRAALNLNAVGSRKPQPTTVRLSWWDEEGPASGELYGETPYGRPLIQNPGSNDVFTAPLGYKPPSFLVQRSALQGLPAERVREPTLEERDRIKKKLAVSIYKDFSTGDYMRELYLMGFEAFLQTFPPNVLQIWTTCPNPRDYLFGVGSKGGTKRAVNICVLSSPYLKRIHADYTTMNRPGHPVIRDLEHFLPNAAFSIFAQYYCKDRDRIIDTSGTAEIDQKNKVLRLIMPLSTEANNVISMTSFLHGLRLMKSGFTSSDQSILWGKIRQFWREKDTWDDALHNFESSYVDREKALKDLGDVIEELCRRYNIRVIKHLHDLGRESAFVIEGESCLEQQEPVK